MYSKNISYILLIIILLTTGFGKVGAQNIKVSKAKNNELKTVDSLVTEVVFLTIWEKDGKVIIYWVTSYEHNNDYFIVQRSRDGQSFEDLIKVNGGGNSNIELYNFDSKDDISPPFYYKIEDTNPLPKKPSPFYRLKQVDYDGKIGFLS